MRRKYAKSNQDKEDSDDDDDDSGDDSLADELDSIDENYDYSTSIDSDEDQEQEEEEFRTIAERSRNLEPPAKGIVKNSYSTLINKANELPKDDTKVTTRRGAKILETKSLSAKSPKIANKQKLVKKS